MKKIFLTIVLFWTQLAFADGGIVGNGGDVIVCKDGSVQLLDIYEAQNLRGFRLDLGGPNLTLSQKVNLGISRLSKFDAGRAIAVGFRASHFFKEAKFLRGISLSDIDDSGEVFLPADCERKQIAIQNNRVVAFDPFYIIDLDLWDKLDLDNQAALIIHEAIFAASEGEWRSSSVRLFNSVGFSNYFDDKSMEYYRVYMGGTKLRDRLMVMMGGDGRWYYQAPVLQWPHAFLRTAYVVDRQVAKSSWDAVCAHSGGKPLMSSSLKEVKDLSVKNYFWFDLGHIKLFGRNQDGTNSLFIFWPDEPGIEPPLAKPGDGDEGQLWCVADQFPIEIPKMKD